MNFSGNQLFTHARRATHQNRSIRRGNFFEVSEKLSGNRTASDQSLFRRHLL
jgi:hypothetical protein